MSAARRLRLSHVRIFDDLAPEQQEAARLVVTAEIEEREEAAHAAVAGSHADAINDLQRELDRLKQQVAALVIGQRASWQRFPGDYDTAAATLDAIGQLVGVPDA